jgi:hypothetical protein
MKKNLLWMLAAILFCGTSLLTACSDSDEADTPPVIENLAEKIQGKWMMAEVNGKPVPTDSKQVLTYEQGSKFYYTLSISAISDLNVWVNHNQGTYYINGNKLSQIVELSDAGIKFTHSPNIISITDNEMDLITNNETFVDGKSYRVTKDMRERKVRVTHDYSADIIGTWEGRRTSKEDAYSDGELHRWQYNADGTYVYYRQNEKGEWVADVNSMAEYFVDGILLCARWKNVGNDKEYRESWEIASIDNNTMKWTAIREKADGSTYTADFSMTRVDTDEEKTLTGEWCTTVNRKDIDEDADENDVSYLMVTFDENGVITERVYSGNKTEPISRWERMRRHGIYSIDKATHTVTMKNISVTPSTAKYSFDKEQLVLEFIDDETPGNKMSITLHHPSIAEKELFSVYNYSIEADDYVGKWFGVSEHNGLYTYVMNDFTEGHELHTIRYSVYENKCTRTVTTRYYNEADVDEEEYDEPTIEIHDADDYSKSTLYWWRIEGNNLVLGVWEYEQMFSIFHPLTQADIDKMAELDKMSEGKD